MKNFSFFVAALFFSMTAMAQGRQQAPMPDNVVYNTRSYNAAQDTGRSHNNSPTFFIYPDTQVDEAGAKALIEELGMQAVVEANHASVYVLNPVGEKYDAKDDFDAFVEMFNRARSGNLKVVGVGNGATFVNQALAATDAASHIAGILTIGGKTFKVPAQSFGVPAYVAGKTAKAVAKNYIAINKAIKQGEKYVNADEPLLTVVVNENASASLSEVFAAAWSEVLGKNFRYNNYKHTHYEGMTFGQYGAGELEPYTDWESLGIKREVVITKQRTGLPWLWYEYWPEELKEGAPEKSVPVMVLLHGNANDPRTQAETSGFIQVAGKERFFVVEMEWQGSRNYGAMGHDGVEQVLYQLLAKYPQLDPSRIYAEGLSAGSMTATALGIKKSHLFAAVGGHSGGIFKGARGLFSNFDAMWDEATQKRGAVEMPYCSVIGTADMVVPYFTPDNYKDNSYLNAWNTYQQMNGMDVVMDLDFEKDAVFGFTLKDRQSVVTNKGEGIRMEIGQHYKGEKPLIRIVAVMDYGHWNFMPTAQVMWDFFKQFSRDPKTKKLIYTPNK
ncbi:MAG: hypothetical protein II976_05190 [Alistipes sp.]|nr:hypothetical protein [Alistipes sp.]